MALYMPIPGIPGTTPGVIPIPIIGIPIPIIPIPMPIMGFIIGFIIIIGFILAVFRHYASVGLGIDYIGDMI